MRILLLAATLAAIAVPAAGQAVDQDRLCVTDPAACPLLEQVGVDAWSQLDFTAMSFADGIQGMEFHCNFYGTMVRDGSDDVLVEAICEEPGFKYPDLISIAPWDETRVQVGSAYELQRALVANMSGEAVDTGAANEGQAAGITLYSRCDNLNALPRD